MNKFENSFFKNVYKMFGEKTTIVVSNFYYNLRHDFKVFGLLLSYPFMFVKFWKEEYKKICNEK